MFYSNDHSVCKDTAIPSCQLVRPVVCRPAQGQALPGVLRAQSLPTLSLPSTRESDR